MQHILIPCLNFIPADTVSGPRASVNRYPALTACKLRTLLIYDGKFSSRKHHANACPPLWIKLLRQKLRRKAQIAVIPPNAEHPGQMNGFQAENHRNSERWD